MAGRGERRGHGHAVSERVSVVEIPNEDDGRSLGFTPFLSGTWAT